MAGSQSHLRRAARALAPAACFCAFAATAGAAAAAVGSGSTVGCLVALAALIAAGAALTIAVLRADAAAERRQRQQDPMAVERWWTRFERDFWAHVEDAHGAWE